MMASAAALGGWLQRTVPGSTARERATALWSFAYFFTLLAGYYVLRPLRDQMGIAGGTKNLPWLFTPRLSVCSSHNPSTARWWRDCHESDLFRSSTTSL
jgi:hypothetical protein